MSRKSSATWTAPCAERFLPLLLGTLLCLSSVMAIDRGLSKDFANAWNDFSADCTGEASKNLSVSCHGVRIVRRVVQQLLENTSKEPDIEIFDGVSLVEVQDPSPSRKGRFLKGFGGMTPLLQFLEGRELRVKLPKLLPQSLESAFEQTLAASTASEGARRGGGGGFGGGGGGFGGGGGKGGGGKKGGGGVMILALMMGKMLAAMGFGALGLLTMKALMVSGLALMLSIIIAVKKLASHHDDGGGHHVVYAQEVGHHHRKKRSTLGKEKEEEEILDLPYRGYADLYGDLKVS